MKKTIIFKIADFRHERKAWNFYPYGSTVPIVVRDRLIEREHIPTAGRQSCKLYLDVDTDDNAITGVRIDFYTLWELPPRGNHTNAPLLPEAYRITGSECLKRKRNDGGCCTCCPWCLYKAPAGSMKLDYPSECYTFTVKTSK